MPEYLSSISAVKIQVPIMSEIDFWKYRVFWLQKHELSQIKVEKNFEIIESKLDLLSRILPVEHLANPSLFI